MALAIYETFFKERCAECGCSERMIPPLKLIDGKHYCFRHEPKEPEIELTWEEIG